MIKTDEIWKVYLAKCADGSMYCGISKDVPSRIEKHNLGKGAKYTRSRRPLELVAVSSEMSKSEALKLEAYIKNQSAGEKVTALKKERKPGNLMVKK